MTENESTETESSTPKSDRRLSRSVLIGIALTAACLMLGGFWLFSDKTDIVFEIAFEGFNERGWPEVSVKPNGKPRPAGSGPFGDYVVLLRPAGSTPYSRQFDKTQAQEGTNINFRVTKGELALKGYTTVAVENLIRGSIDDTIRLSNRIKIPLD